MPRPGAGQTGPGKAWQLGWAPNLGEIPRGGSPAREAANMGHGTGMVGRSVVSDVGRSGPTLVFDDVLRDHFYP